MKLSSFCVVPVPGDAIEGEGEDEVGKFKSEDMGVRTARPASRRSILAAMLYSTTGCRQFTCQCQRVLGVRSRFPPRQVLDQTKIII